jgi:hypothetical protein
MSELEHQLVKIKASLSRKPNLLALFAMEYLSGQASGVRRGRRALDVALGQDAWKSKKLFAIFALQPPLKGRAG